MAIQQPKLVLGRDYVLTTNKGHSVQFKKGVPTHVPPAIYRDAIGIGAVPEDGTDPDLALDTPVRKIPGDPAERNPLILKAIIELVANNQREDFTAAGSPTVEAVSREVGFKVAGKEIAGQWQAYHDKVAEDKG